MMNITNNRKLLMYSILDKRKKEKRAKINLILGSDNNAIALSQ